MRCDEPYEGNEYTGCTKDLGHPGDHEYYGKQWPRPVKAGELTDDVLALIPDQWDVDERGYYLAFEVTNVYPIKVGAESEDDALRQYDDYVDLPDFNRETAIDGSVEVRRPTQYERSGMTGAPIGPVIACPGCGKQAMQRSWFHNPLRKCHGPIKWRETRAPSPRWRWSRDHEAHAGQAVAS
ncbi:hypothetical protein C9F11_37890 [Streptomyces sp. YIM 121038]|uniref:hypothetical protein n=1 Tax=Streptomyces sp. YIM 121038 TaxID=2136401 RepID=UPI0011107D06|nr:hypothetical protein [Streptomyces sp. YIM 121038]QCX81161.1 hypothetical protein C9F11_37890 [Streptomyces sp. YIM 121038]